MQGKVVKHQKNFVFLLNSLKNKYTTTENKSTEIGIVEGEFPRVERLERFHHVKTFQCFNMWEEGGKSFPLNNEEVVKIIIDVERLQLIQELIADALDELKEIEMVLLENTKENENIDKVYMPVYVLKGDKS